MVITEPSPWGPLFYLTSTAAFIAPLIEARLSPRPFFGGLFILALIPFISCALTGFARLHELASYAGGVRFVDLENLTQKLYEARAPFYLGFATTGAALAIHLLLYTFSRCRS